MLQLVCEEIFFSRSQSAYTHTRKIGSLTVEWCQVNLTAELIYEKEEINWTWYVLKFGLSFLTWDALGFVTYILFKIDYDDVCSKTFIRVAIWFMPLFTMVVFVFVVNIIYCLILSSAPDFYFYFVYSVHFDRSVIS